LEPEIIELTEESLKGTLKNVLKNLYDNQNFLISSRIISKQKIKRKKREYLNKNFIEYVSERSIAAWFFHYLVLEIGNKKLKGKDIVESNYDIDFEYNRNEFDIKKLNDKNIIPDLIIHKRGKDKNIVCIEFKGWWAKKKDINSDRERVQRLVNSRIFNYKYGVCIVFKKDFKSCFEGMYIYTKQKN
jgi:hypothetical protein